MSYVFLWCLYKALFCYTMSLAIRKDAVYEHNKKGIIGIREKMTVTYKFNSAQQFEG